MYRGWGGLGLRSPDSPCGLHGTSQRASLPPGSDDNPTSSLGLLTPAWWAHWGTFLQLLKGEGSHSDFTGMTGAWSQFWHSLTRTRLLSQSCLSSYFVHFLVLWLEKVSSLPHPKPTPIICWLFQVAGFFSFTSRIYLTKKSKQLTNISLLAFQSLGPALFTFQNHPMLVLHIMSTVFAVLRKNKGQMSHINFLINNFAE